MSRVVEIHKRKLEHVREQAVTIKAAMATIEWMADEVLNGGGQLHTAQQMNQAVGGFARLLKDIGVVEQLQCDGVAARRPAR